MSTSTRWLLLLSLVACSSGNLPSSTGAAQPVAASTTDTARPDTSTPTTTTPAPASTASPKTASPCARTTAKPEVVAEAPDARLFTTDGTTLFWSDGHAIRKRAVGGGATVEIVRDAVSVSDVNRIEVDGDQLWLGATRWVGGTCLGLVGFVGLDGGAVRKVGPAGCAGGFALTKDKVALVLEGTGEGGGIIGTLYVAPRTKDAKSKVLKRGFNGSGAVATDGTYAYFPGEIGWMHRILLTDGPTEALSNGRSTTVLESITGSRFAVDDKDIYFYNGHLNRRGLSLMKMPKEGGPMTFLAAALPPTPQGSDYPKGPLRLSDTHVYWSHPGTGVVRRVAKNDACDAETVATNQPGADWLTIAGGHLYWINVAETPPHVMRVAL